MENSTASIHIQHTPSRVTYRKFPGWTIFVITITVGISISFALILGILFSIYAYYQFSGVIVPGVQFGDHKLSGMNLSEAALTLHRLWSSELQIRVTNGTQTQILSPSDLGYEFDAIQTAQKALDMGRGGSILAELAMMFASWKDGWQVNPEISFREEIGRQALQSIAPSLSQAPKNATFMLDGENLVAVPSQVGYTIDIEATLLEMKSNPQEILANSQVLVIPQFIPAEVVDAAPVLIEAQHFLDTPVSLQAYDAISDQKFVWSIPRNRLAEWLLTKPSDGGSVLSLDERKVAEFLIEKSAELGQGRYFDSSRYAADAARNIRQGSSTPIPVSHEASEYTVRAGDTLLEIAWGLGFPIWAILDANPGLNPDRLIAGTHLIIPSKDILLPLPAIPEKRIVISIRSQRLWVYQGGEEIREFVISTGIDRSPTQPGIFQVQSHVRNAYASVWNLHMPNFIGIYEAWPGFMNGIHGLPTLANGQRLWANILGKPASYGCIILDLENAEWLYNWADEGVVVEIQP